jgi:DNA polymerase III subunit gamma/tau
MSTLYQKYRPQKFEDILEQNHIKITLGNEIDLDKISHAYLFCGPRGVGKTTVARIFSKAINCTSRKDGEHEPCNECEMCEGITASKNLDIVEIDAASHTGVDNVRENIINVARIAPTVSKYRVFIVDEVHMLSTSAFNALLKIMEEPPKNVVFILCTTEVHKIPETIISRCQRFDFRRISVKGVVEGLEKIAKSENVNIDKKILEEIARYSGGHMRDAKSLFGQVIAVGGKDISQDDADLIIPRTDMEEVVNLIDLIMKNKAPEAIMLLNKLIDDGVSLQIFVKNSVEVLRKMMLASISPVLMEKIRLEIGDSLEIKLSELIKSTTTNRIIRILDAFIKARTDMKNNFIAQLPLEIVIAELCLTKTELTSSAVVTGHAAPKVTQVEKASNDIGARAENQVIQKEISKKDMTQNVNIDTELKIGNNVILNKWNEVLALVKKYNYSLVSILGACKPTEVSEGKITIVFKYKFHKDRIDNPEIAMSVEKVLKEVYGKSIKIISVVDEKLDVKNTSALLKNNNQDEEGAKEISKKDDSKLVDDLLETFGGKVVN